MWMLKGTLQKIKEELRKKGNIVETETKEDESEKLKRHGIHVSRETLDAIEREICEPDTDSFV